MWKQHLCQFEQWAGTHVPHALRQGAGCSIDGVMFPSKAPNGQDTGHIANNLYLVMSTWLHTPDKSGFPKEQGGKAT